MGVCKKIGDPGILLTCYPTLVLHQVNEVRDVAEKLQQGDRFPSITLNLVGGGSLRIPEDIQSRYALVLFYRGHW